MKTYKVYFRNCSYWRRGINWKQVKKDFASYNVCNESEVERFTWYYNPERGTFFGVTVLGWIIFASVGTVFAIIKLFLF